MCRRKLGFELKVIQAERRYLDGWAAVRNRLWPSDLDLHRSEIKRIIAERSETGFLLVDEERKVRGFIEGRYCITNQARYGHVEEWFVDEALRGTRLGTLLLEALEAWFLQHSIDLFLSDTIEQEYPASKQAHVRAGYDEAYQLTVFIKKPIVRGR